MATDLIVRARAGDEQAFGQLVEPYQRELQVHCYRILGSAQDAEDAVQETLLAAWRGLRGFEQRSSLRTWLYRIATSRCLNARGGGEGVGVGCVGLPETLPTRRPDKRPGRDLAGVHHRAAAPAAAAARRPDPA